MATSIPDATDVLTLVDGLVAESRAVEAIDALTEANRRNRSPDIERRLVEVRHAAFAELAGDPPSDWPEPVFSPGEPGEDGLTPLPVGDLSPSSVRGSILTEGCALIRGLVPPARVEVLVDGVDRALAGFDAHVTGAPVSETTPWFDPFRPPGAPDDLDVKRRRARVAGSVWTGDSPRVLFNLLDTFAAVGLDELAAAYLGERPTLSMKKGTLRRVPLDSTWAAWHQDGAFLGDRVRTLNVWLALTHCGVQAPGLDIVPRRLDGIVETGTDGAMFPWTVAPDVVERAAEGSRITRPVFAPGDVLLFDEVFLHRTATEESMINERHAIETWLFAPSTYPDDQIPLVV